MTISVLFVGFSTYKIEPYGAKPSARLSSEVAEPNDLCNLEHHMSTLCNDTVNRLSDQIGQFIQYWGFKSIHGKIWTHIYLAPEPLDAAALMERLKISKSLVSITIADLLEYNVIVAKGKSERDTQVYVTNPNIREVILEVLKQREFKMMERLQKAYSEAQDVCNSNPSPIVDNEKLKQLGEMITTATTTLAAIISLKTVNFENTLKF